MMCEPSVAAARSERGGLQVPRGAHLLAGEVDGDDRGRRRAGRRAAAADHVGDVAERRCRGVRGRGGEGADPRDAPASPGVKASTLSLGCAVLERAARDHERLADRRDGCVAERLRQMRDDARGRAGAVRDDRVEPARAGVAADDVRGAADRRGGRVGARGREMGDEGRAPAARIDADDVVELRRPVSAAEDVDVAAEHRRGGVVSHGRQAADRRRAVESRRRSPCRRRCRRR